MFVQQQESLLEFIGYNTPSQQSFIEDQNNIGLQFENPDFTDPKGFNDHDKNKFVPKKLSKAIKKSNSKKNLKYNKNLCGYILKKVMKVFVGETYNQLIEQFCKAEGINCLQVKNFYQNKIQEVMGLSHLKILLQPLTKNELGIKKVFLTFLEWFLKERYLRHIVHEGRMDNKMAYIEFKNTFFPKYIDHYRSIILNFES